MPDKGKDMLTAAVLRGIIMLASGRQHKGWKLSKAGSEGFVDETRSLKSFLYPISSHNLSVYPKIVILNRESTSQMTFDHVWTLWAVISWKNRLSRR